jgi:hypothetical protein
MGEGKAVYLLCGTPAGIVSVPCGGAMSSITTGFSSAQGGHFTPKKMPKKMTITKAVPIITLAKFLVMNSTPMLLCVNHLNYTQGFNKGN